MRPIDAIQRKVATSSSQATTLSVLLMKIEVRPARREGVPKCIFDGSIKVEQLSSASDAISITVCAKDIYTRGSLHSYHLIVNLDELQAMLRLVEMGSMRPTPDDSKKKNPPRVYSDLRV